MLGRVIGLVIGLLVLASGFGLWKPAAMAKVERVVDFARLPLADFGQYRSVVALLIMAVGLVIALAALQREEDRKSGRPGATLLLGEEEPAHPAAQHVYYEPESGPSGDLAEEPAG